MTEEELLKKGLGRLSPEELENRVDRRLEQVEHYVGIDAVDEGWIQALRWVKKLLAKPS